ncbi:MAG: FAD-binding oxidoreductase [Actinomyces sp.]|nr:MAG: FAD-binding oxidoreductase [Actinomyces sp.]
MVVGGGIAGAGVGWALARRGVPVTLLEAEATLAHHTTGRSAAQYLETYGNETVRRLTVASRPFFADPPDELVDGPLWSPRPMMTVGRADHVETLRRRAAEDAELVPSVHVVDGDGARRLCPVLVDEVAVALVEPDALDLDVAAIHQAFVRAIRRAGGTILTSHRVTALRRRAGVWHVEAGGTVLEADVVVDAAGAWCDELATRAGAAPVGIRPLRRTAAIVALPSGVDATAWPLVAFEHGDGSMDGYMKPEPGGLLVSPADETPSPPCDARPEEIDVALALERIMSWTTLQLRHVRSAWAGLRSFVADRTPVVGYDPAVPGFFWLAGQGGYGIQTAPALSRAAAGLLLDGELPADLTERGIRAASLAPGRPGLDGDLVVG